MREKIKNKFSGISHKWIKFNNDSKEFSLIINEITKNVNKNIVHIENAKKLVKSFKKRNEVWVKYNKTVGTKNSLRCICFIVFENNDKINIELSVDSVINSEIIHGTPKSLNYYNQNEKGRWIKPNDNFFDDIEYPKLEDEFTEIGYEMYKHYTIEKRERN